jgi:predicted dehydrogenase
MKAIRAVVVGAGSIGARHARNLSALGATVTIMDPDPARASTITGCDALDLDLRATSDADVVVIASPTVHHADQLRQVLDLSDAKILVEKPLCLLDDDHDSLAAAGQGRVMVGFNLRLHGPVARAVELVHTGAVGQVLSARVWFGSWLPDWRPDVDYRTTYSARSDLGGGVLLDAIHELDLAIWLTARPMTVTSAIMARLGPLDIDVEDTVKAQLRTDSGVPVDVSLDYLSRRYRRGIEVIGTDATLRLDWARRTLEVENAAEVTQEPVEWAIDLSYQREAHRLLAFADEALEPPVDALSGARSMALAGAIRMCSLTTPVR